MGSTVHRVGPHLSTCGEGVHVRTLACLPPYLRASGLVVGLPVCPVIKLVGTHGIVQCLCILPSLQEHKVSKTRNLILKMWHVH